MNENANIGWLYYKNYYSGITEINPDESFFEEKNKGIIDCEVSINNRSLSSQSFKLETIYPGLMIGTGIIHETGSLGECKLGLQFDHTTGIPYIPGSSVKGLLRSMFPCSIPIKDNENGKWDRYREQRVGYIIEFFKNNSTVLNEGDVYSLEKNLFDGIGFNGEKITMYKRCIFYDAMISSYNDEAGVLGLDYVTPHKNPLKNPIPIQFMKILPEVQFTFQFRLPELIELSDSKTILKDSSFAC